MQTDVPAPLVWVVRNSGKIVLMALVVTTIAAWMIPKEAAIEIMLADTTTNMSSEQMLQLIEELGVMLHFEVFAIFFFVGIAALIIWAIRSILGLFKKDSITS